MAGSLASLTHYTARENLDPGNRTDQRHESLTHCILSYTTISSPQALRFLAKLDSPEPIDAERQFVVSYFLASDTISVYECKSTFTSGHRFLEASRLRHHDATHDNVIYYSDADLYPGARLKVGKGEAQVAKDGQSPACQQSCPCCWHASFSYPAMPSQSGLAHLLACSLHSLTHVRHLLVPDPLAHVCAGQVRQLCGQVCQGPSRAIHCCSTQRHSRAARHGRGENVCRRTYSGSLPCPSSQHILIPHPSLSPFFDAIAAKRLLALTRHRRQWTTTRRMRTSRHCASLS